MATTVEKGPKLPNHGVDRPGGQADSTSTILQTVLTFEGACGRVNLRAASGIAEEEKLSNVLRRCGFRGGSRCKRGREAGMSEEEGAKILSKA